MGCGDWICDTDVGLDNIEEEYQDDDNEVAIINDFDYCIENDKDDLT